MPKQPRRSEYIDSAVIAALRDIHVLETAIAALQYATRISNAHQTQYDAPVSRELSMSSYLWQKMNDAMARAMMFGSLTLNDELRKEAIKQATAFIVAENQQIMGYLEMTGNPPGIYWSDVSVELQQELRDAVAEQTGEYPWGDRDESPLETAHRRIDELEAQLRATGRPQTPEVPSEDA